MTDEPELDLPTRVMIMRLRSLYRARYELYNNGEISIAGLRRLDEAMGLSEGMTYSLIDDVAGDGRWV